MCKKINKSYKNWSAQNKYYSDVTQYNRLAAAVAHFTVFPRYVQGQRWKKSFPEGPEKN